MKKIHNHVLREIAKAAGPIVFSDINPKKFSYRQMDHALQALRKKGLISYLKKADGGPGWVLTPEQKVCSPEERTEIVIVLDRSGSMQTIVDDMEQGLADFLEEQRGEPGRASVTLVQFDNTSEVVYEGKDISRVSPPSIAPRGMTALYDAVGDTIERVARGHGTTRRRPDKTIFLIVTDGMNNASRRHSERSVQKLVERYTNEHKWCFVYLGANQDAQFEASKMGITISNNYEATSTGTRAMTKSVSKGVTNYRAMGEYLVVTP